MPTRCLLNEIRAGAGEDQRAGASNGLAAVVGQDAVTAATKRDDMAPHHGQAAADLEACLVAPACSDRASRRPRMAVAPTATCTAEVLALRFCSVPPSMVPPEIWISPFGPVADRSRAGTAVVEHTAQYCAACCSAVDGANVGGGERAAKIEGAARQIDDAAAVVPVAD